MVRALQSTDIAYWYFPILYLRLWSHPTCWRYINKSIIIIIIIFTYKILLNCLHFTVQSDKVLDQDLAKQ